MLSIRTTGPLMDDVEIRRADIIRVRSVYRLISRGLRFDVQGDRFDRVIFWTLPRRHNEVKKSLQEFGWPVT